MGESVLVNQMCFLCFLGFQWKAQNLCIWRILQHLRHCQAQTPHHRIHNKSNMRLTSTGWKKNLCPRCSFYAVFKLQLYLAVFVCKLPWHLPKAIHKLINNCIFYFGESWCNWPVPPTHFTQPAAESAFIFLARLALAAGWKCRRFSEAQAPRVGKSWLFYPSVAGSHQRVTLQLQHISFLKRDAIGWPGQQCFLNKPFSKAFT